MKKILLRPFLFLAFLLLFSQCQPDQIESKTPDLSSKIQDRTNQPSLPAQYNFIIDENGLATGEGEYEPDNPEFVVNCDGQYQWQCCYLKLYNYYPAGPINYNGVLFGFAARTCDPNNTVWFKVTKYKAPTPPAVMGSWITFWENEGKSKLDPCWSGKVKFLTWFSQLTSGTYNVEAEIRTGGQTWIPPDPIKPWLGGYWEYNRCAREQLLNIVVP